MKLNEPLEVTNARQILARLPGDIAKLSQAQKEARTQALGILSQYQEAISGASSEPANPATTPMQSVPTDFTTALSNLLCQLGVESVNLATLRITATITNSKQLSDFRLEVVGDNGPAAPDASAYCSERLTLPTRTCSLKAEHTTDHYDRRYGYWRKANG